MNKVLNFQLGSSSNKHASRYKNSNPVIKSQCSKPDERVFLVYGVKRFTVYVELDQGNHNIDFADKKDCVFQGVHIGDIDDDDDDEDQTTTTFNS